MFSVSGFFFYLGIVCVRRCVCVAVISHACYIWIVHDITDFNTCFLFRDLFFYSILE